MTGDKSLFKTLKEKEDGFLKFGDGSHSQVLGKGTVDILGLPLLTDVLYIKGLKVNLLSITQICDEDFLVQFSKKGCLILNEEGVQVLKGLRTTDNCYGVIPKPSIACRSAQVNLLELWHQRLGHANYKQILIMMVRRMFVVHANWESKQILIMMVKDKFLRRMRTMITCLTVRMLRKNHQKRSLYLLYQEG